MKISKQCEDCKCNIEFEKSDMRVIEYVDVSEYIIECPICEQLIHIYNYQRQKASKTHEQ